MNLPGGNLSSPMQGEVVALLQGELQQLGYAISPAEIEQQIFRRSTQEAVLDFQRKRGLEATGVVNEETARLINAAVDSLDTRGRVVGGQVRHQDGTALKGLRVRAYDRDLRRKQPVGDEALTDDNGGYRIPYTWKQFQRAEKRTADLVVHVLSPEGTELAVSETLFNAPPQATINVMVDTRATVQLSEYERYLAELAPILEGEPLIAVTTTDISFVVGETGIEQQHIEFLVQAANKSEENRVLAEAFYGWYRQNLTDPLFALETEILRRELERAIEANIIPATLRDSIDAILFRMGELKAEHTAREEANFTTHQVVGRLLDQATNEPLVPFSVRGFDLDAGNQPKDLGQDITNANGLFGLVYTTAPDTSPDASGRRLRLHILDVKGEEIHQTEITVATEAEQVMDIRVPVPAIPEPASPTLAEVSAAVQLPLPPQLLTFLTERGIHTLADVCKAGGIDHLEGLPVAPDDPVVQALESHASLGTLSSDLLFNDALIKRGFTSPSAVARSKRTAFAKAAVELSDFKAVEMYARASAQQHVLANATTEILAKKANGFDGIDFDIVSTLPHLFSQPCGCEDCEAAVSPLAYLADLLDYAIEHLEDDGDPITLSFLQSTFRQRFGDLPASCEEVDRQVRQVRICIEVLRSYLKAKNLPSGSANKKTLTDAEKAYYLEAYTTLLNKIGTSYEEIRLARTAEPAQRQASAERLGIDLGRTRPDNLDALFVEPPQLNETVIETLFGLVDTTRDVLSEGAKLGDTQSQITAWNLNGIEWNRNTGSDGSVYLRLSRPAATVFRVELFRDSARTELVASGERSSAHGTLTVSAKNASELSGKLSIAYTADTDDIEIVAVPRLLSWRLAHLRTLWQGQEFPADLYSEGESFAELKQLPQGLQFPASLADKVSYNADDQLLIFKGVMSNEERELLLSLSSEPNYQEAVERLFENSQRLALIDPDLIGPDDFRVPFAKANQGDPDRAFDLWLKRRAWVDNNLAELRQARETNGLTHILQSVLGDPLPNLDALLAKLTAGTKVEREQAQDDINSLNLTLESLSRLIAIRDKDQIASLSDPPKEPVKPEEWEEVYSILTQAQKIKLFPEWRVEEQAQGVLLGADEFWFSLREPAEGAWPPLPSALPNPVPVIDPDEIKLTELPEPTAGRHAIALWQARRERLDQLKKNLKDKLKEAKLAQDTDLVMTLMQHALGEPNPGDPLPLPDTAQPDNVELEALNTNLSSADPAVVNAATATIDQSLHMPVDDFKRLMAVKVKLDNLKTEPTPDEWEEVQAILAKAQKVKREFPVWLTEEQNAALNEKYWLARKAMLPRWRAGGEVRSAWRQALRGRSRAPVVDPNLIGPGDIRKPTPGDPALGFWKVRRDLVNDGLAALKAMREAAPNLLAGFDTILVSPITVANGAQLDSLVAGALLTSLRAELKVAREANGLEYILIQIWGSPLPDLDTLLADLASGSDSVQTKAGTTIAGTLYLTVENFNQLMAVRQKDINAQAITPAEWESIYAILGEAALVKSIIGLDQARANGDDIELRLDQFNLPLDAFARLARMRNLLVSGAPVLTSEWDEVYAILMQVQKRRLFGAWRTEEQAQALLLGPDDFKIPPPPPLRFPPVEPAPLPEWLATQSDRQDWQDTLQARIDQQQVAHDALLEAVASTEEVTLPELRDALVWASNTTGFSLDARAKWFGDRLLIDAKTDGCQVTTRVAQAIETIQNLLFSVRTRLLNDTYPDLDLDSDDFDEAWEWMGSYATWRTAMFVFLYPENILIPSLRRWQTPAFRELVSNLRSNRRLNPAQAREAAETYAEYFHDVTTLSLEASCQTRTRVLEDKGNAAGYSYMLHMFARGGATNAVYWSCYDPEDSSGYAQSFWEVVPGLNQVTNLIGAVPFQISDEERYIYIFARAREKGTHKLVFIKYDLEQRIWDSEQSELELPAEATDFSAVVKQHAQEGNPPVLTIRVTASSIREAISAIYIRSLNADGADWEDGEWIPAFGRGRGAEFTKLCGMVEFANGGYCLIVSSSSDQISYLLSGDWNDGHWHSLATGRYRGAFRWPDSSDVYVFWSDNSTVRHRAIQPEGNLAASEPFPTAKGLYDAGDGFDDWLKKLGNEKLNDPVMEFNEWLKDVAGVSLEKETLPSGTPYGGLNFYQFLTLDRKDLIAAYLDIHFFAKNETGMSKPADVAALLEFLAFTAFINSIPGLIKVFRIAAIDWLAGKVRSTDDYLDREFGDWKLAARATRRFFAIDGEPLREKHIASHEAFATVLKHVAGLEDGSVSALKRKVTELSQSFPGTLQGLKRIVATSGAISDTLKQFAFQLGSGQIGVYRCAFLRKASGELIGFSRVRIAPRVTGPFTISEEFSEDKLQFRHESIKESFLNNKLPRTNLTYIEEAYHFVPIHLALQLQARGQYVATLDWLRSVYDYSMPPSERKIFYGLKAEESLAKGYERAEDWLLDPLNPHAIAETRRNTYTRFTLLSLVRCMLEFADAEFTRDTAESVPRARLLYLTALELLDTPELKQNLGLCSDIIGNVEIQVGDPAWRPVWATFAKDLSVISNAEKLTELVKQIEGIQSNGVSPEVQFATASALFDSARATLPPPRSLADVAKEKASITAKLHAALSTQPEIATATERAATNAATNLRNSVSLVTGIKAATLDNMPMPWLRQKMVIGSFDGAKPAPNANANVVRADYQVLTKSNPLALTQVQKMATLAKTAPLLALKVVSKGMFGWAPAPAYDFCIPPNPILKALRLRAELNLYKIRTCRNIAGMERQLEPYAAPTDTFSGLPFIGAGGQLVLPGLAVLKPTPYRYPVLIERAKQLVGLAQQTEAAFFAMLERADAERYNLLKARQDLNLAKAGVRLQTLRVKEAEDGVQLAELQRERAQIQVNQYEEWLDEGHNEWESVAISFMAAAAASHAAGATVYFANWLDSNAKASGFGEMGAGFSALASIASTYASYERREQEWEFQKALAEQDVRIGAQGVKIAEDHVRVVEQERVIAEMGADNAKEVVDFLSTKFTNVELYDWMSGVLEGVYSFFLQEATAMAQLASAQLAFERQEVPPPYIQADYWEAPAEGFGSSEGKSPDRRGLTGSARLLQDIYQLDQFAFATNQSKLQLTKTISLAQTAPGEFQRFRETGVMPFATTLEMFDRDFPGHYLRLIRRVRTSVIALIPPSQGIHATLSTTGTSRVVIGGDLFQTVVANHGPQSVALSSPRDATGLFELEQQPEMLLPFEGLGVATNFEFRMLKSANLFADYRTIADVQ
jgi:peptidoglycan hydrolase-like protein with peptidoglycan-binding domain